MSAPSPYYRPPGFSAPPARSRRLWIPVLAAVVFAAAALVILAYVLDPTLFGLSASSPSDRFGLVFPLFFLLFLGFFLVRVAFWSTMAGRRRDRYGDGYGPDRPARIARMRYARGEITREQYHQILQDLGRPPGPS